MRLSKYTFISFFLFWVFVGDFASEYIPLFNIFRYVSIFIVFLFILLNIKVIFNKTYLGINFLLLLFLLYCVLISIQTNRYTSYDFLPGALLFAIKVFVAVCSFEVLSQHGKAFNLFKVFFVLLTIICLFNDLVMFIFPSLSEKYGGIILKTYLLGNKFSVSFKHILWIVFFCLFATKYKEILSSRLKKWGIVITLYSILISLFIDCMTGVIGCLIVLFMIIYQTKLQPLVNKKYTIILCFVLSAIFVFFVSFVMSNELVVYLVTSVFKRDITLTGRTDLYLMMFNIIKDRLLFGYGYGSSIIITPLALNYGNIQNAFWDLVMQIGLVGLAFVFVFINLIPIKSRNYYIMMYLLALIITGTVEITYGASFIIYIYYSIILDKNNKNKISLGK